MKKIKFLKKCFRIRAYCADCNQVIQESVDLTKKELIANWDDAVVKAIGIPCEACNHRFPNMRINLKIVDLRKNKEYEPTEFLPEPGYKVEDLMK